MLHAFSPPVNNSFGKNFDVGKLKLLMSLRAQGIHSDEVLRAIEQTPRENFIDPAFSDRAYDDMALPIGLGQTISQPFVVASMTQALNLTDRSIVLEVGTGCGYQAAILSKLARRVYSVERHRPLHEVAMRHFEALNLRNITAVVGDGFNGLPQSAPFDAIIVTAAANEPPHLLLDQLKIGGVMVIPVGEPSQVQTLRFYKKESDDVFSKQDLYQVRFVPLLRDVPRRNAYKTPLGQDSENIRYLTIEGEVGECE